MRRYGLIGRPLGHSASAAYFAAKFEREGIVILTDMLKNCQLCPRACGADRTKSRGACGAGIEIEAARASLHMWEEPPISGTNGSGTVFFSHCSLGCVFCQNRKISRREAEGQNKKLL